MVAARRQLEGAILAAPAQTAVRHSSGTFVSATAPTLVLHMKARQAFTTSHQSIKQHPTLYLETLDAQAAPTLVLHMKARELVTPWLPMPESRKPCAQHDHSGHSMVSMVGRGRERQGHRSKRPTQHEAGVELEGKGHSSAQPRPGPAAPTTPATHTPAQQQQQRYRLAWKGKWSGPRAGAELICSTWVAQPVCNQYLQRVCCQVQPGKQLP